MPRYFVNIDDGSSMPDREGSKFSDLAEVETAVRQSLVEMMADAALERRMFNISIEVRDEVGLVVMNAKVEYALALTPVFAYQSSRNDH